MNTAHKDTAGLEAMLGGRIDALVKGLVRGNVHRASVYAKRTRREAELVGKAVAMENLIEGMAETQALVNALINAPSALPGLGTAVAWLLIGVEDFYNLDRIVVLVLTIAIFNGHDPEDLDGLERIALSAIAGAYGIDSAGRDHTSTNVAWWLARKLLPARYARKGVNRWVKNLVRRLLPFRRKSRLLPGGLGILISAWDAYSLVVKAGRLASLETSKRAQGPGYGA